VTLNQWVEQRQKESDYKGNQIIPCIFCQSRVGSADPSAHLSINIEKGVYQCWRCRASGTTEGLSRRLGLRLSIKRQKPRQKPVVTHEPLTDEFQEFRPVYDDYWAAKPYQDYLERRGFHQTHWERYDIRYAITGRYANRVIIPAKDWKGEVLYYTARSISNRDPKYLNPPVSRSAVVGFLDIAAQSKSTNIVLCEGPFSAMAVGPHALCLFGKSITRRQIGRLALLYPTCISVCFDPGALDEASEVCGHLFGVAPEIRLYDLEGGDPADIGGAIDQFPCYRITLSALLSIQRGAYEELSPLV
jgi:hypothetical protein